MAHGEARTDRRLLRESRAARAQLWPAAGLGVAMAATVVAQAALLAHVIASAAVHHTAPALLAGSLAALAAAMVARALLAGAFEASGRIGATRVMSELRGRLAEQLLVRSPSAASMTAPASSPPRRYRASMRWRPTSPATCRSWCWPRRCPRRSCCGWRRWMRSPPACWR